jgi:hypothetical protein
MGDLSAHSLLTPLLLTHLCLFRQLNLTKSDLCGVWVEYGTQKGEYNAEGINAIADALRVNGALTALDLSSNSLKDEGASAVCEAIQSNKETKLSSLNFKDNGIGPVGANAVAAMVAVTGALTSLDLSSNQLCGLDRTCYFGCGTYTAEGITAIADALRVNGALTALDLSSSDLKDEGVCAVCEAIQSNKETKLASLNFKNNGIGPGGANAVAAMVAVTGGLTSINLSGNQLCGIYNYLGELRGTYTAVGIAAIAEALRVNGALTVANLLGNKLDEESAKMLAEVAKQKGISLCGIRRDQTTADFSRQGLNPPDAILLASDLSQAVVTGGLTSLNLSSNNLCSAETGYIKASQVQGSSFNEGDKVFYQGKEMIVSVAKDGVGRIRMLNLPDMSGLNALADAFRVNGVLTKIRSVSPQT